MDDIAYRHLRVKPLNVYPLSMNARVPDTWLSAGFHEGHQDEETPFHAQGVYSQVNQKEISPE